MAALGNLLKNSKVRSLLLLTITVCVVGATIVVARSSGKTNAATEQNSRTMAVPKSLKAIPGNETPEKYRELQIIDNKNRAEEAKKTAESAIPTIIRDSENDANNPFQNKGWQICGYGPQGPYGTGPEGKVFGIGPDGKPYTRASKVPCIDPTGKNNGYQIHGYGPNGPYGVGPDGKPFGVGPDGKPYDPNGPFVPDWYHPPKQNPESDALARLKSQTPDLDKLRAERLAKMRAAQEEQDRLRRLKEQADANAQQAALAQKLLKERSQSMEGLAQALLGKWSAIPTQAFVQGNLPLYSDEVKISRSTQISAGGHGAANNTGYVEDPSKLIPGGTILFAVIDTAVNSDQPGPILATIVSGLYRGSRLIGSFQPPTNQDAEGILIKFDHINIPKSVRGIGLNAIAIDPDTARTVLASDVDHHYLMRYGTLFASSFMAGYGQVLQSSGASQTSNTNGSTTNSTAQLSPKQTILSALGTVGTQWGSAMGNYFSKPPTITIDQGTSVAILLVEDLNVTGAFSKVPPPPRAAAESAAISQNLPVTNTVVSNVAAPANSAANTTKVVTTTSTKSYQGSPAITAAQPNPSNPNTPSGASS
ncbi:MAG: TrbI/VirB10 family protein [Pseudomonadota bacterium]